VAAHETTDLDGNPRFAGGTVDIGAYEFQAPHSAIAYAWLQYYGLPADGSADHADPDGDGINNSQEWICGTNPTNAFSALRLLSAAPSVSDGAVVSWQSVGGITYSVECTTNLASSFTLLTSNVVGRAAITSYADTNATGVGPFWYRVGVQRP
jgi:hypothetical protein